MTESEAIEELKRYRACSGTAYPEEIEIAINALEKQEKIKEVFTHYVFFGNKLDLLNDCISALSEIKAILKE